MHLNWFNIIRKDILADILCRSNGLISAKLMYLGIRLSKASFLLNGFPLESCGKDG
jgi:hypothetical protein